MLPGRTIRRMTLLCSGRGTAVRPGTRLTCALIHFQNRNRGWVVGGRDVVACPGRRATRDVVRPVVLFTEDGGNTWTDLIPQSAKRRFPLGEWGWKIFFLDDSVAFISLENFLDGAILKSVDGGK